MELTDSERLGVVTKVWPQMPPNDFDTYGHLYDKYFLFLDEQISTVQRKPTLYSVSSVSEFVALIQQIRGGHGRKKTAIFPQASAGTLRAADIAIRLWLTIDVQHATSSSSTPLGSFEWGSDEDLPSSLQQRFKPRGQITANQDRRIPSDFSLINLITYFKFRVRWTSNLLQHLRIDWRYNEITIFEHAICLRNHIEWQSGCPLPTTIIEEAIDTIQLLFPGDKETKDFLERDGRDFLSIPFGRERLSSLGEFSYWQRDISDLLDHWEKGPKGWQQVRLSPDRGNLLEYLTFWTAAVVLILTLTSIAFGIAGVVFAKKALDVSVLSYELSLAVACAAPNATEDLPTFCR